MLAVKKSLTSNQVVFRRAVKLMGDRFEISVIGNDAGWADERIDYAINEINRVEKLLSAFSDDSVINQINRNAGIRPVKVSAEVFNLIDRSLQVSELTHGTFDITYYSSDKDSATDSLLETDSVLTVAYTANYAGYKNVVLDRKGTTVFLRNKEMRIGFGANKKGYAADRAKCILQMNGVSSGVINAGGDLLTWGLQTNLEPWTIGAADLTQLAQPYANINISNMAIATSVNAEKYAIINKKGIAAKPTNGFIVSEISSVSVLSPTAEFADAMASPVMNIGINSGLYLVNQLNQIGCVIIDDYNRIYTSKDIHIEE
jgi:thiamine biosynthesis lipoprotein